MKPLFITATDTDIGKTFVCSGLAYALKKLHIDVGIMKPFACGDKQKTGFSSSDLTMLTNAAMVNDAENIINPFFFPVPASPYTAAKNLGVKQIVDIGSGDGRIAYCAKVVGLQSYGIEIDENLVGLENKISSSTGVDFQPMTADATQFDFLSLGLSQPVFFISGLPEVGEMLANSVISRIMSIPDLEVNPFFVFTGSHMMRKDSRDKSKWGWGQVIDHYDLEIVKTVTLPTYWTFDQEIDTPFIFTRSIV